MWVVDQLSTRALTIFVCLWQRRVWPQASLIGPCGIIAKMLHDRDEYIKAQIIKIVGTTTFYYKINDTAPADPELNREIVNALIVWLWGKPARDFGYLMDGKIEALYRIRAASRITMIGIDHANMTVLCMMTDSNRVPLHATSGVINLHL